MTNQHNLVNIVKDLTNRGHPMTSKIIAFSLVLLMALPFSTVEASTKKNQHRVHHQLDAKTHAISKSQKPIVSSKKRFASHKKLLASNKKYFQKASLNSQFNQESVTAAGEPQLASAKALVMDQATGEIIFAKNINTQTPIASVTKLMTAMVMLDAHQPMDEVLEVTDADVDMFKGSSSKLPVGSQLTRAELLHMAVMSSENRAASALGRNYPGGIHGFVAAMNEKARALGMTNSHFVDSTGLHSENISTAADLSKMVRAAYSYPQIRQVSTSASHEFNVHGYRNPVNFSNTNLLVRNNSQKWVIGLSKTGYISEAGRCLVMQAEISGKSVVLVFLDSMGKFSRIGDAERIRKWMEARNFSPSMS
ncbi:Peptidase S11 D-alanyl-D-alanine carboxypeptidase 1 [Candidatus Methylopumilus turicensis]|uniref:Peptidase S11 D-alanyl-D-alanine carboxypeptidase 1 n=2 Tax=Candidatus Methylopumilus turicensis TaxID=1581680 RepID=A0A0B7IXT3_9PROT|nr:Peptidase S11 D-alanyl-D-alanine carboxypeptidase 1 [Candidatus Methylopumilus turicensis]